MQHCTFRYCCTLSFCRYHVLLYLRCLGLPASIVAHKPVPRLSETEDELEDIVKPHGAELSLRQVPTKKREPVKIILPSLTVVR